MVRMVELYKLLALSNDFSSFFRCPYMGHRFSHVGQETVLVRSVLGINYKSRGAPRIF